MSKRYNQALKLLNLSNFANDDTLIADDVNLTLSRGTIIETITKIIQENIPELVGLDLSHNRLFSMAHWQGLIPAAPHLCALNLSHNNVCQFTFNYYSYLYNLAIYALFKISTIKLIFC